MSTSTIKLYYSGRANNTQWELLPNKLLVVDDIAQYLASKSVSTISKFQYIKNELEISIVIDWTQVYAQPLSTSSFKYVSIQNDNEIIHYYFIKKITWRSQNSIRLDLVMDVLNTFQEGTDYIFKENSKINREHKDRFKLGERFIYLNYQITLQVGTIDNGDSVTFVNDHGDTCFTGVIDDIDQYRAIIKITSNESESNIRNSIDQFIEDDFEINHNSSNYLKVSLEDDYTFSYNLYRNIDFVSESINPLLVHKNEGTLIEHSNTLLRQNWYLLYRNVNDPSEAQAQSLINPVNCYLIPETAIDTAYGYIKNGRIIPSFIPEGYYYFFHVESGQTYTLSNGVNITTEASKTILIVTSSNGKLNATSVVLFKTGTDEYSGALTKIQRMYDGLDYIDVSPVPVNYNIGTTSQMPLGYLDTLDFPYAFNNSGTQKAVSPITNLDRTDSRNIKLIKLPYCPFEFTISSNTIQVSDKWDFVEFSQYAGGNFKALKLKNLNTKLSYSLSAGSVNPFLNLRKTSIHPTINANRYSIASALESKLFHSEFYEPTYVYDSFIAKVELEKCDINYYMTNGVSTNRIKFTMTSTINSRFLFSITDYHCDKNNQNFYNVITIARNNEEVLYNVAYINYIRSGFNYDVKAKELAVSNQWANTGLSAVAIGTSLLMPSAPLKVAGVVAGLVSIASSLKNAVQTERTQENTIQSKLQQAKMQTSSVAGSDDVDLMSEYCGNRLQYIVYEPTDIMKNLLNDLFFYAGYTSNRMGLPNHNTRIYFDYLECDASIEAISSIPNDCLEELIGSFKNGVTYLHKVQVNSVNTWDFAQSHENWEVSVIEEL